VEGEERKWQVKNMEVVA